MTSNHRHLYVSIILLLLVMLACRPVIAIGWPELLTLLVIIAILLGPVLLRIYRTLEKLQKLREDETKQKPK